MTGDEHYQEAESILRKTAATLLAMDGKTYAAHQVQADMMNIQIALAKAQAHATLAQAAATVDAAFVIHMGPDTGMDRPVISDERSGWGYGR